MLTRAHRRECRECRFSFALLSGSTCAFGAASLVKMTAGYSPWVWVAFTCGFTLGYIYGQFESGSKS